MIFLCYISLTIIYTEKKDLGKYTMTEVMAISVGGRTPDDGIFSFKVFNIFFSDYVLAV